MIDTSEDGKVAAKNSFLHTLAIGIIMMLPATFIGTDVAIVTAGILLSTNLLLYYILRVGLDIKKIQKQLKYK